MLGVVVEQQHRHLRWAALADAKAVRRGLAAQAVAQPLAHGLHVGDAVHRLQLAQRRQRRGHRHRAAPEGAGDEDRRCRRAEAVVAGHRGKRMAVGDGLAPRRQVGAHAQRLPTAGQIEARAGTHLVENQCRARAVAQRAHGAGEGRLRQFLVDAVVVPERRDQHRGQVPARLRGGLLQAADVVVAEVAQVRAVLGQDAGGVRRAPGRGTVAGPLRHQQLAPAGGGARRGHADRGRVGAVLREQHPVGMRDQPGEMFGQCHQHRRRGRSSCRRGGAAPRPRPPRRHRGGPARPAPSCT